MRFFRCCVVAVSLSVSAMAVSAEESLPKKTPAELMPWTAANWRGHQSLYHEGWRGISSTEKSLAYAKEHGVVSSGEALSRAFADIKARGPGYEKNLVAAGKGGMQTGSAVLSGGTEISKLELAATAGLAKAEWDYGSRNLGKAWERFYKGNLTLVERTEEDWQALNAVPGDWLKNLRSDFSNLDELTENAKNSMSTHIEGQWGKAFEEARAAFNESYQQSGMRGNSLAALGDIMVGYTKVLYSGLVKPASRSAVQGTEATAKVATKGVFLPLAPFIISGRTLESVGLGLYYTTSMGVSVVAPTIEGGLLTGLSLLSYGATVPTAIAGATVGAVNQIAVVAAAPTAGLGRAGAEAAGGTAAYAAQVTYDALKGGTKVTINFVQSGVVLGYNAVTAVPAHLVMGVGDAVFLAYDGPHLVLASVKGQVQWSDKSGEKGSVPLYALPVGSVVDLHALSKEPGVQVQVLSDDPAVVQKVLEKLPDDLREGKKP